MIVRAAQSGDEAVLRVKKKQIPVSDPGSWNVRKNKEFDIGVLHASVDTDIYIILSVESSVVAHRSSLATSEYCFEAI